MRSPVHVCMAKRKAITNAITRAGMYCAHKCTQLPTQTPHRTCTSCPLLPWEGGSASSRLTGEPSFTPRASSPNVVISRVCPATSTVKVRFCASMDVTVKHTPSTQMDSPTDVLSVTMRSSASTVKV